jgi:tRNA pseudouridine32 synthase/23S rRNA pseudouridine746 synthase
MRTAFTMNKLIIKQTVKQAYSGTAADFLAEQSGLSKGRVKDAMNKGAVWIKKNRGKMQRTRRASVPLHPGDRVEMYYDERLLSRKPPAAHCLHDMKHYSVWHKPPGMMSQGTKFGDHCSLLRQAELFFSPRREVYPVHRLDREVPGVMLIAHSQKTAAALSAVFQKHEIEKEYLAGVIGDLRQEGRSGKIDLSLNGKPAITKFKTLSYDQERNVSVVKVFMKTGRYHQIRRHFHMIGHPVLGDPRYGRGNKNSEGIQLSAVALRFHCPFMKKRVEFCDTGV